MKILFLKLTINNIFEINWSIVQKMPPPKDGSKGCELCLNENFHIIVQMFDLLNQRKELLSKCWHGNKFLLCNFKGDSLSIVSSKKRFCYKTKPPDNSKKKPFQMAFQTVHDFKSSGSFEPRLSPDSCINSP